MNASLESLQNVPATRPSVLFAAPVQATEPGPEMRDNQVREGILEVPGEVSLYHGGKLEAVRIAWRLVGPATAPVVCALGGISAHRRVCTTDESCKGWWSALVGEGLALDTRAFRVLSFDYLGGSGETTGLAVSDKGTEATEQGAASSPAAFPSVSSYDQAEVLLRLLNHLGIKSLRALVGGSYGGMVALAFGERYPERVSRLLVIGAADRPHPLATAWRSTQRNIVRLAHDCGRGAEGLEIARALAMATYRSAEEFAARFSGLPVQEGERFVFPVEQYLHARGKDYAQRYRPESFLCLSESIDLHRVDAACIFVPTVVVAIREDQLVPLADLRAMTARLPAGRLYEISSLYGHDAFLKEADQLHSIFTKALGSAA